MASAETSIKRIVLIGPESTGKTTMAEWLAAHFATSWSKEYLRLFVDVKLRHPLLLAAGEPIVTEAEVTDIAIGQVVLEDQAVALAANGVTFLDTNLLLNMIYARHYFGKYPQWMEGEWASRRYDHYLLFKDDLPWVADPQRESEAIRHEAYGWIEQEIRMRNLPFSYISGRDSDRRELVLKILGQIL